MFRVEFELIKVDILPDERLVLILVLFGFDVIGLCIELSVKFGWVCECGIG